MHGPWLAAGWLGFLVASHSARRAHYDALAKAIIRVMSRAFAQK
jgi:hypothetical protein